MKVNDILQKIAAALGPRGLVTAETDMAPFLEESRGLYHGRARAVVLPASTGEVAAVLALCHEHRVGVVPQGGNTGRCGGAAPAPDGREILLNLGRLDRIRAVDPLDYTLTADAGCILADVQAAARGAGRFFPLSLGAEGSCQLGGCLATNAGGTNVLRYGNARELTLGLEVVLPDGRVWNGLNALRKNNTGYDLRDLFIGAEGTLGVITAAVMKLYPEPVDVQTAFVALRDLDAALELLALARGMSGDAVTTFELMSRRALEFAVRHMPGCRDPFGDAHEWYVLLVLAGTDPDAGMSVRLQRLLESAWERGLAADAALAASEAQAQDFRRLREGVVEAQPLEGGSIKHDVSVPVSRVPELIRQADARVTELVPGIRPCAFGHLGDGNIHYNLSQPVSMDREAFLALWERLNHEVHDIVAALGGSFSAEHGVGRLKVGEMARYKSPVELDLMQRVKRAIDPRGIMNPGKVLPE